MFGKEETKKFRFTGLDIKQANPCRDVNRQQTTFRVNLLQKAGGQENCEVRDTRNEGLIDPEGSQ